MSVLTLIVFIHLTLAACALGQDKRQNEDFTIQQPKGGDVYVLKYYSSELPNISISWTAPPATVNQPAYISVVQGNNDSSLVPVKVLNALATNNGSYTWYSTKTSGLDYGEPQGLPSGCNYSISIKVSTAVYYSGYFSLINPKDGGLATNATCPTTWKPSEQPCESAQDYCTDPKPGSNSTLPDSEPTRSTSGISTQTLVIAVVIPIVVLIAAFILIIWLGIRRQWFVKYTRTPTHEPQESDKRVWANGDTAIADNKGSFVVGELDASQDPHFLGGSELHQLPTEGVKRNYTYR
ncbi:hypothetical protein MBLNU457_1165t2 [Dothideomycetes sp. NU457]